MAEQTVSLGPQDVIGAALIKRAERDEAFRLELLRDPRTAVERALGLLLPDRLRVQVQMEPAGARAVALAQPEALLA
jgi:hypothetical protein